MSASEHYMLKFAGKLAMFCAILLVLDLTGSALLKRGLELYYGLAKDADLLIVGHSRTVLGIDQEILEQKLHCSVAKYAIEGTSLVDHREMIEQYLDAHPHSVKALVYIVDDYTFGKGLGQNQYRLFYPFMESPNIAKHIRSNSTGWPEYVARKYLRLLRFSDTNLQSLARMGFMGKRELAPDLRINLPALQSRIAKLKLDDQKKILPGNVELYDSIIRLARGRYARVVLFYLPFIDLINDDEYADHDKGLAIFRASAAQDPGVLLIEIDAAYSHRHDLFSDATHPNRLGRSLHHRISCQVA